MMKANKQYNEDLILAYKFLKERYETYKTSNRIKSNPERIAYAHAIETIRDIAYNTTIHTKHNPHKTHEDFIDKHNPCYYNTVYDE